MIERFPPRVDVGLIHWPECTNDPCTCLDGPSILIVTEALAFAAKMLNDHELRARVDKGSLVRDMIGFDWYCDWNPFAIYDYVGFFFI